MHDIYADLKWRGLVYQSTADETLGKWLLEKPRVVYSGFDPTADSLHVGSLLPLMMLRRFQKAGHRPIALVGGATGMIGDPSGKSAERNLLSSEQLELNVAGVRRQFENLLETEGSNGAIVVNNYDWISRFSCIDYLRDIGKNFPVNVMLTRDSVKNRLEGESGLSYTEFSYMLLQAYDFVHLHRQFGCELQVGGSDQWGNITAGTDLGRRMGTGQLYGMTCPLLTKSDGSKMGKTETGAIWLSADRTSPYEFYQYWLNTADEDTGKCLRFLTELSHEEIARLDQSREQTPESRESQKVLASEITRLIHGTSGVAAAEQATRIFFGEEIRNLNDADLGRIFHDVPGCQVEWTILDNGQFPLAEALVSTGLVNSKGEAKRAVTEGSIYLNNRRCTDAAEVLGRSHLASESTLVLRRGKKKYAIVRFR